MNVTMHFNEREWADFARGLGEEAQRAAMHQHLSTGCSRCQRFVGVLSRFAAVAASEAMYEPSEQTVGRAEAVFQPQLHAAGSRITRQRSTKSTGRNVEGKTPARAGV